MKTLIFSLIIGAGFISPALGDEPSANDGFAQFVPEGAKIQGPERFVNKKAPRYISDGHGGLVDNWTGKELQVFGQSGTVPAFGSASTRIDSNCTDMGTGLICSTREGGQ